MVANAMFIARIEHSAKQSWSIRPAGRCYVLIVCAQLLLVFAGQLRAQPAKEWPYERPAEVAPPKVNAASRVRNGIDAFILKSLEAKQLSLNQDASPETLIRRLYLDLVGLPPTPQEVDAFFDESDPNRRRTLRGRSGSEALGDQSSSEIDTVAWEKLVNRLLDDSRYGERWARYWLDLARYADTAGYEGDPDLPHAWRYRDYVIDAFNQDKPFDQFITEQIAGDEMHEIMGAGELPQVKPERTVALTFLRLAPFTEPRGDASRHELLSEMTATVASTFLGLTVGCAQCHDHKYDEIPIEDFYRMKAFFASVQIPPPLPGDIFQIGGSLPAEFYRDGEKDWAAKCLAVRQSELEKTQVEIGELDQLEAEGRKTTSPMALTADQQMRRRELKSHARSLKQDLLRLQPLAMSLRHSFGPPYEPGNTETYVLTRGEWDKPGNLVQPGFLSCVTGNQEPAEIPIDPFKRWPTRNRRLILAKWIASPDNPLTARVIVNRLWAWHFGRGIVATPSDFGKLSSGPSHPELLNWLANQLVASKWSIKAIHRLILNSTTWRQSSNVDVAAQVTDPDNRLLWRFAPRRVEAEVIRDSVLAVSGRLNTEQFGLPIFPPLPEGVAESITSDASKWLTQFGPEGRKRSIYIYQQRSLSLPLMQTFDAIVCDAARDVRQNSVTPLQALAMYNGSLVSEEARHFADRVQQQAGTSEEGQIELAFRLALCRSPTRDEVERMSQLIDASTTSERLPALCRVLLNSSEFVYLK
jgi:Protein of unknown function (DUF1553)/Protein of unknown function (DUF1549)